MTVNTDTQIFTDRFRSVDEVGQFLQYFGRDLVSWTHAAVFDPNSGVYHYVTARVTDEYGDFEDDMYVPFDSDITSGWV